MPLGLINLSEANSIAIHLCIWIANTKSGFSSTKNIAEELAFSHAHASKVVQYLVHAGILETERGPAGGSRLARPADEITLLEIIIATGGNPGISGCMLKPEVCSGGKCLLHGELKAVNDHLLKLFGEKTLADVVKSINKKNTNTGCAQHCKCGEKSKEKKDEA